MANVKKKTKKKEEPEVTVEEVKEETEKTETPEDVAELEVEEVQPTIDVDPSIVGSTEPNHANKKAHISKDIGFWINKKRYDFTEHQIVIVPDYVYMRLQKLKALLPL